MSTQAVADEENYNKEYRRLRTLTSQTDIRESSVSVTVRFLRGTQLSRYFRFYNRSHLFTHRRSIY